MFKFAIRTLKYLVMYWKNANDFKIGKLNYN